MTGGARSATPAAGTIPDGLRRSDLPTLYYYMRLTRSLEERIAALKRQGKIPGGVYRSLGQEADAVGSAFALDRTRGDVLCPLIRNLGSLLVRGAEPVELLRQSLATAASPSRGRELHINICDLERGYLPHISNLGDMLPVMCGVALSFKLRMEPRVALVYSGDGATSTGAFHEGINLAAVQRVPLVVVVEHNHYAYSTPARLQFAVEHLAQRAKAYGIPSVRADGNDVLEVYRVTREAVDGARAGRGVTLVELKTYRRLGHAEHDDQRYVPEREVEAWAAANDPLTRYAARLVENGWAKAATLKGIDRRVTREIDEATERCLADGALEGEGALRRVRSGGGSPRLWFRGG